MAARWFRVAILLPLVLLLSVEVRGGVVQRRTNNQQQNDDDGGANNNYYVDESSNYPPLEICDDLIVQVTRIQTVCDSPQTFYYGSGVNRNSVTCNYGDKATTTVYFDVTESLDTNIYVVMSVYAGYGNEVLTATSPKNLKKYVGYSCNEAGSYSYTYSTTLSSSGSGSGSFVPYVQIAFSSETNGDYNLGAANIPCRWDDEEFGEWTEITAKSSQFTTRDFLLNYGILISTVTLCLLFVAFFIKFKVTLGEAHGKNRHPRNVRKADEEKANALMVPPQDALA